MLVISFKNWTINDPDKMLAERIANLTLKAGPTPFLGCTVDKVYDFYKAHLRPLDDNTSLKYFTHFVFLAIDEECVQSTPRQIILCCDAPDYSEENEEIKLKHFRMPMEKAVSHLCVLEFLKMTPSEVQESRSFALCSVQPVTVMPFEGPRAEYNF